MAHLEDNLKSQLGVKRFARSDSRRAVKAADRRREVQSVVVSVVGIEEAVAIEDRRRKVRTVEQVKHFYPELCRNPFPDEWSVLEDREVHISVARTNIGIASGIPKCPRRCIFKSRRV